MLAYYNRFNLTMKIAFDSSDSRRGSIKLKENYEINYQYLK
jgi:hypothetical protein